jgi:polysaccharide pyruvyl transferase WcaK-like protein
MLWKNIQYSGILFLGRLLGKKAAAFGVGAGKPERFSTKLCEKVFLKSCNIVVARDIDTYNDYRTKTKRAILGLDLAMLSDLPPVSPEAGRLGVSLVDMERYDLVDQLSFWKALIEKALEGNPSPQLHLFAFRDNDVESDLPITIQIADWGKSKGWPTTIWKYDIGIERMLEEIARCEKVLATRYHSAIFAARANVPMCIVPYNEKLLMLARDLELPSECVINLESWSSSRKISDEVFGVASLSSAFYKRQSDFRWALTAFFSLVPGRRIEVKSSGTVLP